MAATKISELPSAGVLVGTDMLPIARPGGGTPNARASVQSVADFVIGPVETVLTITAAGTYSAITTTRMIEVKSSATGTVNVLLPHAVNRRIVFVNYKTDAGLAEIVTITAVAPTSGGGAARTIANGTSVAELEGYGTTASFDPSPTDWIVGVS